MTERFVSLIPLGPAPFQLALQVTEAASGGPFGRTGRQTLWTRRFRAAVVSSAGAVLERCVLHLPTEELGDASGADLELRWATAHSMLVRARTGGAEGHFPELVLPRAEEKSGLAPMVYCSVPNAFFGLPCPTCLEPLETCRDDAFLARSELPLYGASSTRLLVCPKCTIKKKASIVVDPREVSQVVSSSARQILGGLEYLTALAEVLSSDERPKAPAGLRCADCTERGQCWDWVRGDSSSLELRGLEVAGSASRGPRWRVFTTHTVPFLVTRPEMVPLESFVQRIGSESSRQKEAESTPGIEHLLFEADGSGMDSVEVLTLRLTAFRQAVRAVREHYRMFDRPHLDISSESLMVAEADPAPGLPALWRFRVRLDPTSAYGSLQLGDGITVPIPPDDPVAPFFSPSVRDFHLTGNRIGELRVTRLTPEPDGRWRMEANLLDPRGVFPTPGPEDWVRVQWSEDRFGLGVLGVVARVDPRERQGSGRGALVLTSEPLTLEPSAVERIQQARGVSLPDVTYRVFPKFGPKDDLYSLGMVLFLCILVNDTNDLGLVTDDLALLGLGGDGRKDWDTCAREQVVRNPETWGSSAVFYDAVDRSPDRPNLIPDRLWVDIVTLGLRMVGASPSIFTSTESGTVLFDRVEAEVEASLRQLRALLFDRQPLNLEIQTVIAELLNEG